MPRKSLGAASKSQVVAVRVTEAERLALIRKYGTPSKGLRALLTAALKGQ